MRLGPGTLDEAVQRLEEAGYISETDAAEDPENGQVAQRRYYKLTSEGWSVLRTELRHLARLVDHAQNASQASPGRPRMTWLGGVAPSAFGAEFRRRHRTEVLAAIAAERQEPGIAAFTGAVRHASPASPPTWLRARSGTRACAKAA